MNKNERRIVAIIQARMGSSRLPGKVLMEISGKPILWHVVNRLRDCRFLDQIVIATSVDKKDDAIEKFCKDNDISYYRGNEADVLDRYYQTAKDYDADIIARITADCPLIDPKIVDRVITGYFENMTNFDGASNIVNRRYPRGLDVEVVSFSSLERCWEEADKDYQKEHVTPYIYEHPEIFKIYSIESKNNEDLSCLRWTVDEEADLQFVREIYKRLHKPRKLFLMDDVLQVLKKEPYLGRINRCIKQKEVR